MVGGTVTLVDGTSFENPAAGGAEAEAAAEAAAEAEAEAGPAVIARGAGRRGGAARELPG